MFGSRASGGPERFPTGYRGRRSGPWPSSGAAADRRNRSRAPAPERRTPPAAAPPATPAPSPPKPRPPVSSRSPKTPPAPVRFRSGATSPRPLQSRGGLATPAGWADPGSAAGAVGWRRPRRRSGHMRGRRRGVLRWLGGGTAAGGLPAACAGLVLMAGPVCRDYGGCGEETPCQDCFLPYPWLVVPQTGGIGGRVDGLDLLAGFQ